MKTPFDLKMDEIESETRKIQREELRLFGAIWSFALVILLLAIYNL